MYFLLLEFLSFEVESSTKAGAICDPCTMLIKTTTSYDAIHYYQRKPGLSSSFERVNCKVSIFFLAVQIEICLYLIAQIKLNYNTVKQSVLHIQ